MSLKVAKSECLDFSPPLDSHYSHDKSGKENSTSIPVLSLLQFSRAPFVSFGTIRLGSSKSLPLRIENPTDDATATVIVDKISASKGFSVDQMSFTIQPEDSIILTVTWTPVEEGGVRELLCFIANGIVKHQAILLGKAETTKKKKKTLWDSIKSKKGVSAPSNKKKVSTMPIKSVNKTFHVSRQSQYRKDRTSNPLSPITQNGSRRVNAPSTTPEMSKPAFIMETFDNVHLQKNSPVVVLVPAERLLDTPGKKDAPSSRQIECREITRVLNKTLSPASTPERFRNPLSSGFQSPLPVIGKFVQAKSREPEKSSLSVKDALDVIGSDLSHAVSPPNACSSFDFSDSLESDKPEPEASFRARRVILPPVETADPRLTFCVKPNKAIGVASNQDEFRLKALPFSTATVTKSIKVDDTHVPDDPKKFSVNSATVVKSKADASVESPGLRKKKTSRRRLLEKTLELSEPSNAESNTSSPDSFSALPVISSDSSPDLPLESKICVIAKEKPTSNLSPHNQLLSSISPIRPQVFPSVSKSPSSSLELSASLFSEKVKPGRLENQFPVQSRTFVQSKKRKSDEFLRGHSEDKSNIQAKKCRAPAQATEKPSQERTLTSRSTSGPQRKAVAPPGSRKFTRPPPKKTSPKTAQKDARSVKSANSSTRKPARIVAVAQARLTFMKPTQTAIPRHPLPFAAKNMFYDERWIEKQERGFTWWMNYILTPDDFKVATEVTKVNALSLTMGNDKFNIPKAPTKEEMSFRTYTARQRLNRLRRAACKLFTSEAMVKAIQRLELEVEAKRLLVRKDRHLWKDIGERQKVLNWLISYNPLWLRIGLETIYGELISLESNNDVMGLAMFILGRLLWNPDIAAEFRHSKVPHLYRDGHEEALSRFTLKKLILLVCFLDKAKESRLIEHDPCLFCMDAEFKSSKDLLLAFSRDFLSGEGILSRHLSHLGLAVSHVQTPLDEFDFAVKKLAVDLKCGIRLVRVMELFTLDWTLSRKLRIPAISRLQKVHNVDVALQVLKNKGVDLRDEHGANIDSRDIVDGHREKTLNLLWKIIFAFQVEVLLDENQLKEEISFLRKTWRTKQKLASIMANNSITVSRMKARQAFEHPSQKVTLLMDWVNAVCEFYSLKAENFTVSFSDGRILCYLIHHYHPGHLHAEEIQQRTTQTIECGHRGRVELNNSSSDSDCSFENLATMQSDSVTVDFRELLENEKSNFQLVNIAVSYLGGVPAMINPEDMSNTIPNEKVVTCYLSFLCARLLDLRNETRAARVIQGAWRRYKLQKDISLIQEKNLAATKIQALVRKYLLKRRLIRQNKAAIVIQTLWRGYSAREKLRVLKKERHYALQNAAATLIQKTYKAWRVKDLLKKNRAAFVIQAAFRKWHAKKMLERNTAALCIQAWYRMQQCRRQYLEMKRKAVCVQAWFRGHLLRSKFQNLKKRHHASVVIQSAFRAYLIRKELSTMRRNVVLIQRWFRACVQRKAEQKRYFEIKSAVLVLQAAFRGWKVRKSVAQHHQSALVIQTAFRRFTAQRHFLRLKRSAIVLQQRYRAKVHGDKFRKEYMALKSASVTIQAMWRGQAERRKISQLHRFAKIIQSNYRRHLEQTRFLQMKQAAVVIQRQYRAFRDGQKLYAEYTKIKRAAIMLQSAYRGRRIRQELQRKNKAATLIQSVIRAHMCRQQFLAQKHAAIVIQQQFRAFTFGRLERSRYMQLRKATITMQAMYRGSKVRQNLKREHQAATVIQAQFRMHKVRIPFVAAKCAAILIQQHYRAYKVCKTVQATYLRMKNAAVVIQSAFRGMKVRNSLRKSHQAAKVIQAHFRGHSQLKKYQRQQWAASVLQQRFKATVTKNAVMKQYAAIKTATISIQSAFRGMVVRKQIAEKHKHAKIIQKMYRAYKQRHDYLALRNATIRIQQQYRAVVSARQQHQRYCSLRAAAITLQSSYRGLRARKEINRKHKAATVIQAAYKMYRTRVPFQAMKLASLVIQRQYRCHLLRKEARENFLKLKHSAVAIQAIYRGKLARRDLARRHFSATIIQRKYLAYKQRKCFLTLKAAVIFYQQHYRSILLARHDRKSYLTKRRAVVAIQASFRGINVRRKIRRLHKAATIIQSHVRMRILSLRFQRLRWAVCTVQERFRANKIMRQEMAALQEKKSAALILQAAYRGIKTRQTLKQMHQAATIIQSHVRMRILNLRFQRLQWAVCTVQQRFRANKIMRQEVAALQEKKSAALILQAAYRGMKTRQTLKQMHHAATIIQSHVRKHILKLRFQRLRLAVCTVQRRFKANTIMRLEMAALQEKKSAALILQAAYRGMKTRKTLKQMHQAATIVQATFRAYSGHKRYLAMKCAAIAIQQRYRAVNAAKQQRKNYLEMRQGALVLQACYRGGKVRRKLQQQRQAAILIQSYFRRHKEMVKYQAMKLSAVIIQSHFRSYILARADRKNYLHLKKSAIVIQAAFKGQSLRKHLARKQEASIIIQAGFRMYQQRSAFKRQRWAARVLQQRFRALKLRDEQVCHYQQVRNAAICLQRYFRGMKGRELARRSKAARTIQSFLRMSVQRQRFMKEKAAAIAIQSAYRGHCVRVQYTRMQASTVLIQKWYRSRKLVQEDRKRFVSVRQAALTLQSALRGMLVRRLAKRRRAAIKIQSVMRMHIQRKRYVTLRAIVLKLQAHYRMFVTKRRYRRLQAATVTLQRHYRSHRATLEQRCSYLKTLQNVKKLQARVRGHIGYKRFQRLRTCALTIQAYYRGMVERRRFQQLKECTLVIQKHYRAFILFQKERSKFLQLRQSAVVIQRAYRAYQMRQNAMKARATLKIQAWFRGRLARRNYILTQAAIATIRRCVQARRQRSKFLAVQHSVRVIQQKWRETLNSRKRHAEFLRLRKSVIYIQALWRGRRLRDSIQKQITASVKIQSAFRGFIQRRHYHQKRDAAITLQRHFRVLRLARVKEENLRLRHNAAIYIQALCRGWLARQQVKEMAFAARRLRFTAAVYHHLSAIKIQRAVRAHWALKSAKRKISSVLYIQQCFRAKLQRKKYLKDREDVIKTQRAVRSWLNRRNQAASIIQHAVRKLLFRRRKERLQRGIIRAQALWRGHCSRKHHDTNKVISMRQRLREVNQRVKEEDKLCNKTTTALSYLLGLQNYAFILAALKHLETATRLSPECCERLVESGATHTIFTLIRSCNRSVPSMEIITLSIQVLLNLSKYHRTIDAVYDVDNSVETLLDLLQIYREKAGDKVADKGGSIFTKTCFLLVLLVQDERRAMEIRRLPKVTDRIRSIYRLTLRKCKMDAERNKVKQKMNTSLNGSFLLQATPRKSKPVARFAPDWVLRRDKMKDIVDPLRAIQILANALAIVP
ncbi:abnormal spindle-like microcephaly-associated protein [Danio aesculapii]|uniref:abnormal spindle-like microcephaly-associated protein n=1 Tax=Danio aesculapii TaxID=1142201 RepID=UPI0024BF65A7|nr:abnormal spindle-like microcephaly-associated protein [Danio aesculapii]